jgi:hypothetical protein
MKSLEKDEFNQWLSVFFPIALVAEVGREWRQEEEEEEEEGDDDYEQGSWSW